MIKLKHPSKVEVKESPGKGFGVFATEYIRSHELIEECHMITLPIPECMPEMLHDYRFNYPQGRNPKEQVIVFGFGSIYNHSEDFNAFWMNHPERDKIFQYFSNRDIYPGEEICTWYGNVEFR